MIKNKWFIRLTLIDLELCSYEFVIIANGIYEAIDYRYTTINYLLRLHVFVFIAFLFINSFP